MNDASGKKKGNIYKNLLRDEVVKSLYLTRYAVKNGKPDPKKPVLTTGHDMAFVDSGVSNWKLDIAKPQGMTPSKVKPPFVSVTAPWYTSQQAMERGIKVVHGSSANVFGYMGALLVPDDFTIPTVTATKANVRHYGLELIEDGGDICVCVRQVPGCAHAIHLYKKLQERLPYAEAWGRRCLCRDPRLSAHPFSFVQGVRRLHSHRQEGGRHGIPLHCFSHPPGSRALHTVQHYPRRRHSGRGVCLGAYQFRSGHGRHRSHLQQAHAGNGARSGPRLETLTSRSRTRNSIAPLRKKN